MSSNARHHGCFERTGMMVRAFESFMYIVKAVLCCVFLLMLASATTATTMTRVKKYKFESHSAKSPREAGTCTFLQV
jgi:NADH:ubiquinone oxidoreductase subunit 3 (subunit A)